MLSVQQDSFNGSNQWIDFSHGNVQDHEMYKFYFTALIYIKVMLCVSYDASKDVYIS